MSGPRPIPEGLAEEIDLPAYVLCRKYHCRPETLQRWRTALGYQQQVRYRCGHRGRYGGPSPVYYDRTIADICLNCTEERCSGNCARVRNLEAAHG